MPYLIGPNSEPITPKPNSATNRIGSECSAKPMTAMTGDDDLGEFQPLRHDRLVVAVGQFAAERGQEEIRRDEHCAPASVISASAAEPPILNRIRKTSAVFRKLSLNAAKNWHQNSGAKRLDSIRGGGMAGDYCRVPAPVGGAGATKKLGGLLAAQRGRYR